MKPSSDPSSRRPVRVLFVCLGNICRSPVAEGVFQQKVSAAGLDADILVDSAGTGGWHHGAPPDARMTETAARHGVDLSKLKARQLRRDDLTEFDHVFVMDKQNLHDTLFLDPDGDHGTRVRLFREFDPEPGDYQVPDPYYGAADGFETVFQMVDRTTDAILHRLARAHDLGADA